MFDNNWSSRDYQALKLANDNTDDIPFDEKLCRAYDALYAEENFNEQYVYFGSLTDP